MKLKYEFIETKFSLLNKASELQISTKTLSRALRGLIYEDAITGLENEISLILKSRSRK